MEDLKRSTAAPKADSARVVWSNGRVVHFESYARSHFLRCNVICELLGIRLSARNEDADAIGKERARGTGLLQGSPPSLQLIGREHSVCDRLVLRVVEQQNPAC